MTKLVISVVLAAVSVWLAPYIAALVLILT
jgi:hypothetical protein